MISSRYPFSHGSVTQVQRSLESADDAAPSPSSRPCDTCRCVANGSVASGYRHRQILLLPYIKVAARPRSLQRLPSWKTKLKAVAFTQNRRPLFITQRVAVNALRLLRCRRSQRGRLRFLHGEGASWNVDSPVAWRLSKSASLSAHSGRSSTSISRSAMLIDLPCASSASERVTPPPSALPSTKLNAPRSGSS